ncbi:hypothetical protein SAMN04487761_10396 [Lachnospiraceae bacterium C7]|nr:hypothetical protein SAMN04487761_10396 [Lachnospiraceae bacterium C7]
MIRLANLNDLDSILKIYAYARNFMKESGNPTQWNDNFPPEELLINDIDSQQLYVYEENNRIHGVFALIIGEDPTYATIDNGAWLSDTKYGTIHRVASDGQTKGVFTKIIDFCNSKISHLRVDTHSNNKIMQHIISKNNFVRCGIIYVRDGSPRIAYERL